MKKLRLTKSMKDRLVSYAIQLIDCPEERIALKSAQRRAAALVRKTVIAVYPIKDMRVCQKYEVAKVDDCIKLRLTHDGVEKFDFLPGTGPLVVKATYTGKIYDADDETTEAVLAWTAARDVFNAACVAKLADYKTLILSSYYLEDVIEIWPEAEAKRGEISPILLPSPFTPDVVARIKADVATRVQS